MARPDHSSPTQLERDLTELKLLEIAKCYREVLDEAARKGSSMLEVLATLVGLEQTVRQQCAWNGGYARRGFPNARRWPSTTSTSPRRLPRRLSCVCSTAATSLAGTAVLF